MPAIRPMREADSRAVHDLAIAAFEDLSARMGEPPEPRPDPSRANLRFGHLIRSDPAGAWVAEDDGQLVGAAVALMREGVWGLSLLVVRPGTQSTGLGRALLARAHDHGRGARGRIILSSPDPRAIRAYARLGLTPHPSLRATGAPHGVVPPAGIRDGGHADIPFTVEIDRQVRGAAHGEDIGAFLGLGARLLVGPGGYAVVFPESGLRLLAARDAAGARDLLRAVLAGFEGRETAVEWLTATQAWAVDVCLDAGLELRTSAGVVFLDGDVGPFSPYLPSGAFL
jgi:GNAT superfamily N-acetyltransferase